MTTSAKTMLEHCPNWPQCRCVMQGFVNYAELNDCGRKPKKRQKRVRRRERRDIVDVIFKYYRPERRPLRFGPSEAAIQKSAPVILAPHNSGERDPAVTPDWAGADTAPGPRR